THKLETSFLPVHIIALSFDLQLGSDQSSKISMPSMPYVPAPPKDGKTCHIPSEMV
ncbi:hypothetical protein A2U01_0065671, partial [Trifolium medium]|nr:hypothetical protein [Trifolium medium]